ncbi:hypothetical protein D3821_31915 [Escherichia coli]|nr:hypothetical protein D3821_31915 [Escherichia coli]
MALHAEAQRHRVYRLLTKCALFMPDAALTPYPAYKIVQIQYIAEFFVGLISGAHQAFLPLPSVLYGFLIYSIETFFEVMFA